MGSYNAIARALDPFEPLGPLAETWLAATGIASDTDHYAKLLTLQKGVPQVNDSGSYVYTEIHDSKALGDVTKITVVRGIYRVTAAGAMEMQPHVEYSGQYLFTNNPSNNPDPLDRRWESIILNFVYTTGTPDTIVLGGDTYFSLKGTGGILDRIYNGVVGTSTQQQNFARLNQIDIYLSQVIIPGFGEMISGSETLNMYGNLLRPTVDFSYEGMVNHQGLRLTGIQRSVANASGDGSLSESVDITVDSGVNLYSATVGYDGIHIKGTVPSSGFYTVTVDVITENVDYTVLNPGTLYFTDLSP